MVSAPRKHYAFLRVTGGALTICAAVPTCGLHVIMMIIIVMIIMITIISYMIIL